MNYKFDPEIASALSDGAKIELRWYERRGSRPGSAVVYAHGGGMILSDVDKYDPVVSAYVDGTGVPFLSVNYRLAPESHGGMLAEDTFSGLTWLLEHASRLGVDAGRARLWAIAPEAESQRQSPSSLVTAR